MHFGIVALPPFPLDSGFMLCYCMAGVVSRARSVSRTHTINYLCVCFCYVMLLQGSHPHGVARISLV
jgi:hypothetical protein